MLEHIHEHLCIHTHARFRIGVRACSLSVCKPVALAWHPMQSFVCVRPMCPPTLMPRAMSAYVCATMRPLQHVSEGSVYVHVCAGL